MQGINRPKTRASKAIRFTYKHIADAVSHACSISKEDARKVVLVIIKMWAKEVRENKIAWIPRLGRFRASIKPQPKWTKWPVKKRTITFTPVRDIKMYINGGAFAQHALILIRKSKTQPHCRQLLVRYLKRKPDVKKWLEKAGRLPKWYIQQENA